MRQRQTAKPSASFKLHFANGPKRLAERIDMNTEGRASSRDCAAATEGLTIGANPDAPGPPPRLGSRASAAD